MIDISKRIYPEHLAALSLCSALEVPERERFAQDLVLSVLEESVRQHHDGRPFPTSRVMHDVLLAAGYALIAVRAQEQAERILQEDRDMRAACPLEVDNVKVGDAVVWVDPDMAAPDSPRPSPTRGVVLRFLMHQDEWRALCTGGWWCQPRELSVEMTAAQRRAFPDARATVDAPAADPFDSPADLRTGIDPNVNAGQVRTVTDYNPETASATALQPWSGPRSLRAALGDRIAMLKEVGGDLSNPDEHWTDLEVAEQAEELECLLACPDVVLDEDQQDALLGLLAIARVEDESVHVSTLNLALVTRALAAAAGLQEE